jgi:hypothetical protein
MPDEGKYDSEEASLEAKQFTEDPPELQALCPALVELYLTQGRSAPSDVLRRCLSSLLHP